MLHKVNNVLCNPRGIHKKVFRLRTALCVLVVGSRVQSLLKVTFYRPQQSCGNVMFLHMSVILFTGRGGVPVQGSLSRRVSIGGGVSVQGVLCQGDPLATIRLHVGGTHPTGMHSCCCILLVAR